MQKDRIIRSAGTVGGFTMLSRGLGLLRDIVIAYNFGTSLFASAFFVAFTLPNLFRRLFGEGALSAAFVPVFIETYEREGASSAWKLAQRVSTLATLVLVAISVLGIMLLSLGLQIDALSVKWQATFALARIMFPYLLFICLAALAMGMLHACSHFAISAFMPSLFNLILIGAMLLAFPQISGQPGQANALAWAVLIAGIAQLAVQWPVLHKCGASFGFSNPGRDPQVRKILRLMGPSALGMAFTQFNVVIDRLLAMWIGPWAPAALFYSERLVYFPLGVIAGALGTVLLPTFSKQAAMEDDTAIAYTLERSLCHTLFIMIPAAVGLLLLAGPILAVLFDWHGAFDATSTRLGARALMFYAPGLLVFSVAKLMVPAFYALQDARTPAHIGFGVVGINLVLNLLFIFTLPEFWKHAGMAAATVLAEAGGVVFLVRALFRRLPALNGRLLFRTAVQSLWRALLMGAAAVYTLRLALRYLPLPDKGAQVAGLALSILLGMVLYFVLARRMPEMREIRTAGGWGRGAA